MPGWRQEVLHCVYGVLQLGPNLLSWVLKLPQLLFKSCTSFHKRSLRMVLNFCVETLWSLMVRALTPGIHLEKMKNSGCSITKNVFQVLWIQKQHPRKCKHRRLQWWKYRWETQSSFWWKESQDWFLPERRQPEQNNEHWNWTLKPYNCIVTIVYFRNKFGIVFRISSYSFPQPCPIIVGCRFRFFSATFVKKQTLDSTRKMVHFVGSISLLALMGVPGLCMLETYARPYGLVITFVRTGLGLI